MLYVKTLAKIASGRAECFRTTRRGLTRNMETAMSRASPEIPRPHAPRLPTHPIHDLAIDLTLGATIATIGIVTFAVLFILGGIR